MKNIGQIMKQAQAMQEQFKQKLDDISVEASAGGGMVKVEMNGNKVITRVQIDPEVVNRDDIEMLQDLIAAAVNETARKADEEAQRQLGSLAGNLKIPGMF